LTASAAYERALVLHHQHRYADAERELRAGLGQDPHDPRLHAMLALCLTEQKRFREATEEAQAAIGLAPDDASSHYALASVLFDRQRFGEAAGAIEQAIRLDMYNPAFFALLSGIRFEQRSWPAALAAAEKGLELDPENNGCANLRAMALVKLGRRDEAGRSIGDALHRDPDNANTHANQGWTLLHQNRPRQAMEHFREALRLDPNLKWAQAGIVEALKARNPIYRLLLMYFLWMARLRRKAQWALIIGGYIGYRFALDAAEKNPQMGRYLWPIVIAYIVFAVLTWLADPLFNLLLRLHPFGKYALSPEQRIAGTLVGIVLLCAIFIALAGVVLQFSALYLVALMLALLMFPVSAIFRCDSGWPRWTMAGVTALLFLMLMGSLASAFLSFRFEAMHLAEQEKVLLGLSLLLLQGYGWGILIASFGANALVAARPRR
jgi:Tfp pilus assembly protein PilF